MKRYPLAALFMLLIVPSPGQDVKWETISSAGATTAIVVVGDVNDVLQGRVKPGGFQPANLSRFQFAAGAGTVGKPGSIGEMLAVPGHVYVKSIEHGYRMESSSTGFSTPFCFALPKGARPHQLLRLHSTSGISLERIYESLSGHYGRTFAVAGMARFRSASTTAVKRAPFYGEPISTAENRDRYFHPVQTVPDRTGVLFGVVVNTDKPEAGGRASALEKRMVYVNYADKNRTALQSHSHLLFLGGHPDIPRDRTTEGILSALGRARPVEIRHLLTQSSITDALLLVYDVRRLEEGSAPHAER